jgi:pimeloyl-ACP methyl ester carboxylesterase
MKTDQMKSYPALRQTFAGRALLLMMLLATALGGCFRLDSTLYNPDNSITEYKFNAYPPQDWWDIVPGGDIAVPDSLVHLITLESRLPEETDAKKIYAVYVGDPARIATDTVIFYMHGNGGHLDAYWPRILLLANVGGRNRYGVMAVDYRGYGLSEGTPTEEGLYTDSQAAIAWLEGMGLTGDRLAMYGYSMGTAPATELTANPRSLVPGWLCLEAPFAGAAMMGQAGTGLAIPGSFFTNLKIDNAVEIRKVNQPFFWIHGMADDYIDFESHGEVVWKNYQGTRGVAVPVPGANHGNVPGTLGQENYRTKLQEFLEN